jgi:hypothetical protein
MAKQDNWHNGGARVSNVLGCICKDEVGSITEGEGNINSIKCVDILDNNRLPVVLKFENYQWIFQDDTTKSSVFSQQFFCESHKLLNRLWIDLLQIGTGTNWLNSSIQSRNLLLRSCFTCRINVRSPCLLVDLGRPVHGLLIFILMLLNLDTIISKIWRVSDVISTCVHKT